MLPSHREHSPALFAQGLDLFLQVGRGDALHYLSAQECVVLGGSNHFFRETLQGAIERVICAERGKKILFHKGIMCLMSDILLQVHEQTEVKTAVEVAFRLSQLCGVYAAHYGVVSAISNEKLLGIEIYLNNNDVEIIISNSYLGKVDTKNVNEKGYSTKGKNHGYGLPLVKNILEHSDIFSGETITCNDIYTQKLNIKGK